MQNVRAYIGEVSSRAWGKLLLGTVVIGGMLTGLWSTYGPRTPPPPGAQAPAIARLAHAAAIVRVRDGSGTRVASIACNGRRRRASGFWARNVRLACDALASTRVALLSGPGCRRIGHAQVVLTVEGSFGARRFAYRAARGGCPDPAGWLAVDALAAPVLTPDQQLNRVSRPR